MQLLGSVLRRRDWIYCSNDGYERIIDSSETDIELAPGKFAKPKFYKNIYLISVY